MHLLKLAMRLFMALCILMLSGCAHTEPSARPIGTERYQIAEAALRYLMDKHSGGGREEDYFSAYVIKPGEFTPQLVAAFANYKPKVVSDIQVSSENGGAVNKATGKPVKLWSVKVLEIHRGYATAGVTWYSGNLAAGGHTVHLKQKNGRWIVVSEKMNWIS